MELIIKAILFDIDGTLLKCHGAGKKSLMQACLDIFGTSGKMEQLNFQGKTDPWILKQSLLCAGIAENELTHNLDSLKKTYAEYLEENISSANAVLLPGVTKTLQTLNTIDNIVIGLLTGNFKISSFIKLRFFGLDHFFSFGAYGDDAENRNDLPGVARIKINNTFNCNIHFHDMIIIGDTSFDIECAKKSGAVSLAVGTGWTDKHELLSHKPDYYFDDLSDTEHLITIMR